MLLVVSGFGCAPKPRPVNPDERGCYLAVLGGQEAATLQAFGVTARPGDVLMARSCVDEDIEGVVNEVRRLTR
jgi:hypothetical protein